MKRSAYFAIVILITILITGGIAFTVYRSFFLPNEKVVPAFEEGQLSVVVGGDVADPKDEAEITDDRILLPISIIKQYIDPAINWDDKLKKVTITTKDRVIRMKTDSLQAYVNNEPVTLNIPATEKNGTVLIPIEFLSDFYNIDISYVKTSNVIIIDFRNSIKQVAEPIEPGAVVRIGRSVSYPIIRKLDGSDEKENRLRVFEEYDKWYKVRTVDGAVGYIEKKYVSVTLELAAKKAPDQDAKPVWMPAGGKLVMAWDYAYSIKKDLSGRKKIDGLDVISPTWFQAVGTDGSIKNSADAKYVEWAHKNGYKVWALFSNDFGDTAKADEFLRNTDSRDNAIRQILAFAALYGLDGINLDFENLLDSDRDALTQFVREMAPLLREQGLVVSVDINTAPCYDRKALGSIADYTVLMAYDQHWAGGETAGSVAELSWVDSTVRSFASVIPKGKLILGIPFYTRLWEESKGTDGITKLDSKALSMGTAEKLLAQNNATVVWDNDSGQFFSEFEKDGTSYEIWLEDSDSINLRTSLVLKYELAGTAAWRLDFETSDVWSEIIGNLKSILSYSGWKSLNDGKNHVFSYTNG